MKQEIIEKLNAGRTARGAWHNAIIDDAVTMLDVWTDAEITAAYNAGTLKKLLLNGADGWTAYSYGGCALIYDADIARHYCTPSEYRRTDGGRRQPNNKESWLDVQARALWQAARLVIGAANSINK